jgi:hypothetical protein
LISENNALKKEVEDSKKILKTYEDGEKNLINKIKKLEERFEALAAI